MPSDVPFDRAREALLQRVQRKYLTVTEAVSIGPISLVFQRVANPDEMLERLELAQQAGRPVPKWQPYWAENWAASWGVAQVLVGRELAGRQVLDLGCGLGLTGAIAAAKGATVWMVDAAHPALLFSRLNTWPWRARVHVRRLDWRQDQLAVRFPLILGSDIIYDREDWPYLDLFWRQHLAEGGGVLLGESGRSTGAEFPGWLEGRGWTVHRSHQVVPQAPKPIRIFEAAPCGAGASEQRGGTFHEAVGPEGIRVEDRAPQPGPGRLPGPGRHAAAFVDTDCGKIAMLICYDIEFPELVRIAAQKGAQIVFVPFNTETRHGYLRIRHCALARCVENHLYVAVAGCTGNLPFVENADIHYAQSAIFTPADAEFSRDAIAAECNANIETMIIHDVDVEQLRRHREAGSVQNWNDRRRDLYKVVYREGDEFHEV